jgi:hypothetical protein
MASAGDYGPHGPNMSLGMCDKEAAVLKGIIYPDDIYTEDGTYWADLPITRRIAFVNKVDGAEARDELRSIGRMMKHDPLSPVGYYFKNMVIPGAGLLLEG